MMRNGWVWLSDYLSRYPCGGYVKTIFIICTLIFPQCLCYKYSCYQIQRLNSICVAYYLSSCENRNGIR